MGEGLHRLHLRPAPREALPELSAIQSWLSALRVRRRRPTQHDGHDDQ